MELDETAGELEHMYLQRWYSLCNIKCWYEGI